ncbi:MAG: Holliday junction DNA helicase RuvB [Candidatus Wildermuthbacteria bacterium RIFCSPLOWO2_01_FULL_48_29]|uniref:Holliday junction branch migration complex subunit RuvB n=2 Tax=Candidatus Wildermuthiibacteriota TaxID=1817923 RepID=A0A1G2RM21_9BACT|nr:MAG: Holliday junction DNA helicase RuvB [Candidatus Wildermuthbacteria bacterium RIFCSPHIGHO2_01_FULL_48_27b]OHA73915.1 MAG: Holliday junction DNA helicase RuvB [Candidatus Wildermuthbacteria bacterium RIFCSPLOWO2_01_FULL_48_29]
MFVKDPTEEALEKNLRPKRWDEYLGQKKVKDTLKIIIEAAKKRAEPLEHLLFYGSPGLGKTTLAHVIANELGANIKICTGPTLEKAGDLASILTNLEDGDILFLDECHRMQKAVMEMLYSALEEFQLHLVMGRGPMARTMDLDLPRFTLIGATTRMALLPAPLRNRFGAIFQLQFYTQEEIEQILRRSSALLRIAVDEDALHLISTRSRYTPRIANRILKRVRDFATIDGSDTVTKGIAEKAFSFLEIDELGLEPADRKVIEVLIHKFLGGPVGIQALASAVSEEEDTILDLYEPYLLQLGLLERTPRGRVATALAYRHFQTPPPKTGLL